VSGATSFGFGVSNSEGDEDTGVSSNCRNRDSGDEVRFDGEYDDEGLMGVKAKSRLMPLTDEREEERERSELSGVQYTKSRGCLEKPWPDEWDDDRL
jgi:hypothetical protein